MKNFLILIAIASIANIAFGQSSECDRLAASPLDPQKQSPGVSYERLNAVIAIPACKAATTENPKIGRLWFQYGRALEKANKLPDAIAAYQEAAKLNSGVAYNNLGELYRDGKGFQRDIPKAQDLFKKAAELNSPEGKENLAKLNQKPQLIPKEFIGNWGETKAQCSDSPVRISAEEIYTPYIESICIVRSVNAITDSAFSAIFSCKNAVVARTPYPSASKPYALVLSSVGSLNSDLIKNEKPLFRCK